MVDFRISQENVFTAPVKHVNTSKNTIGNIYGYFDTGCSYTSVGLYSLSKLLGLNPNTILQYVNSRVSKGYPVYYSNVANGDIAATIPVSIVNCTIGKHKFNNLYCMLNINDKLCESNGVFKTNDGRILNISAHMLLGLDLIRSYNNITFERDFIIVDNFNEIIYEGFWNAPQDIIKLYQSMVVKEQAVDALPEIDDLW